MVWGRGEGRILRRKTREPRANRRDTRQSSPSDWIISLTPASAVTNIRLEVEHDCLLGLFLLALVVVLLSPPFCWLSTRGLRPAEMGEICVELSSWWERSTVVLVTLEPEFELDNLELLWLLRLRSPL